MKISTWVLAAILLASATAARADQITFTETAVGSGSLGNTSFSDALITLTGVGDTANITFLVPGVPILPMTVQVEIAGLGTATFTDAVHAFSNQNTLIAGFNDKTIGPDILTLSNAAFAAYGLTTPINVTGPVSFFGNGFHTSAGIFDITGVTGDVTFTATSVPEPSALALAALGAAGCLAARRFTRRPTPPVGGWH